MAFDKSATIQKYRTSEDDSGSTRVQVAILTDRINFLNDHFRAHVQYGDTIVLAAVTVSDTQSPLDFFPLLVEYREKTYAAGKIPGGYIKREGRPSDNEILSARIIDRSIRPLFPEGFKNEVQV